MAKGSVSNSVYSGLYKTRRKAVKAARRSQSSLGGTWYVVNLDGLYIDVHEEYLRVHTANVVYSIGFRGLLVRIGLFIEKTKRWLTGKK